MTKDEILLCKEYTGKTTFNWINYQQTIPFGKTASYFHLHMKNSYNSDKESYVKMASVETSRKKATNGKQADDIQNN